jgi:hypothetical protein
MMPATGRYSTSRARQAKKIFFCRTRTVVIQGRELKGHLDSHIFGKGSQCLTAKKLGRSTFSGLPGTSLCEWGRFRGSRSRLFGLSGLSSIFRSLNQTNQKNQTDQMSLIPAPRREMWPGTFSFRPIGGKSLRRYSARPYCFHSLSCAQAPSAAIAREARRSDAIRIGAPNYFCVRSPCTTFFSRSAR